jgi:hypothetical protein
MIETLNAVNPSHIEKKHQTSINHPLGYSIHRGRYMDYLRLMDIKRGEIGCS